MRAIIGFCFKPTTVDDRDYIITKYKKFKMKHKFYGVTKCLFSLFKLSPLKTWTSSLATSKFTAKVREFLGDNGIVMERFWDSGAASR